MLGRRRLSPDIVIVGAPKTGTSAVTEQLRRHRQVFVPDRNEPRLFLAGPDRSGPLSREFNDGWVRDSADYDDLFAPADGRITVDASTDYLSQPDSAARLADRRSDAKVVIGLRHPATRAFSEHVHLLREGAETESFERALALEPTRQADGWVPLFEHAARSTYAPGLTAFTERFDTLIYHHEDMRSDPAAAAARLSDFLGLDQPLDPAPTVNAAGAPRSGLINGVLRPRGVALRTGRAVARRTLGAERLATIRGRVDGWNLETPPPPSPDVVAELLAGLEADIAAVEDLLQVDLDRWRVPPPEWL